MSPLLYIGNGAIGLAIGLSLFGMISFYTARKIDSETAAQFGRATVYGNFILMTVANLAMVYALLGNDFSISYVSHVGSRETPRWISAISLWSSLEGSILFWGWVLSAYSAVCIYQAANKDPSAVLPSSARPATYNHSTSRSPSVGRLASGTFLGSLQNEGRLMIWVGIVLLSMQLFFYLLLALPANPFQPVQPVPDNGPGPNPLLQNHWLMAIHPPCLYIGSIGFTIPFAFAIAELLETTSPPSPLLSKERGVGGERSEWVTRARPWILFAWSFQSMAIVLGGWWSYAVLGWGGYWAWDPVENASFMPWLVGTALVHSIMVQEKRKMLAVWNLVLAILTFLLTLVGTFLTRSGILDSVHSFTESQIGPWFLVFIGIVFSISVALLLWRGPQFRKPGRVEGILSLEVLILFNNLLFLSFCFVVFLGTFYPLLVEAIRGSRISVGQPYFNQMTIPITGMILLLMGIGLITPWRKGSRHQLTSSAKLPLILSGIVTLLSFFLGGRETWVVAILFLTGFAFFVMLVEVIRLSRDHSPLRLLINNPRRYGGFISHTGALMIIVAVTLSATYGAEQEITLKKGESATVKGYTLTLEGVDGVEVPQRFEVRAPIRVAQSGRTLGGLVPQMNYYPNSVEPIASPAIRSTLLGDLYLTLIHFEKDGSSASLRVLVRPAVAWIWIGGITVMLGGLLAFSLGRKKSSEETG